MKRTYIKLPLFVVVTFIAAIFNLSLDSKNIAALVPYTTHLMGLNTSGVHGNGTDSAAAYSVISKTGRYIAFSSESSDLVSGDTNGKTDVFLRDRTNNTTSLISVSSSGTQGNNSNMPLDVSADGRYILFQSDASNLVSGDTNAQQDIFLRDTQASTTEMISAKPTGGSASGTAENGGMSRDGRYVVFKSNAWDLLSNASGSNIFLKDRKLNTLTLVSKNTSGTGTSGASYFPTISCDGAFIAFDSDSTNLVPSDTNGARDIFLVNRIESNQITDITSTGNGDSSKPSFACNGESLTFKSAASNLVTGDTNGVKDVFVYDLAPEIISRISVSSSGTQANAESNISWSRGPSLSANGRCAVFDSTATNLVSNDTNGTYDVFLYNRDTQTTERLSMRSSTQEAGQFSEYPSISADGKYATYRSLDSLNSSEDTFGTYDAYVSETGLSNCSI